MRILIVTLLVLSFAAECAYADRSRQALRAIEKGEFEKAKEFLVRSYNKDSLNPLVSFAYCQLYMSPTYESYHIDSARLFIKLSLSLLPQRTKEHNNEMDKSEVQLLHFDTLKVYVDSLGFDRAKVANNIVGYDHFITNFEDAKEVKEAVRLRDVLLFDKTRRENNWRSYKNFVTEYPDAEQALEADSMYHKLIYIERTQEASTEELESFLIDVPDTYYRLDVEQRIFRDKVSSMNIDSIYRFTHRYTNDSLLKVAMGILYHWEKLYRSSLPLNSASIYQSFIDSTYQIEELNKEVLIPFYKDGNYRYHRLDGSVFINSAFDQISSKHFCGNVIDDVLMVEVDSVMQLINRNTDVLYQGTIDDYDDLGEGVVRIAYDTWYGAVHKSGFKILPMIYDEIQLLNGQLLMIKKEEQVGLSGILGEIYLEPKYNRVYPMGEFWIIENEGMFAITNLETIRSGEVGNIQFNYEEVELLNNEYIIGYMKSTEEIMDQDLNVITPEGTVSTITKYEQWIFRTDEDRYLYDSKSKKIKDQIYKRVLQNDEWLGLFDGRRWTVYGRNINSEPILNVDSVKLIGRDIVVVFRDNQGTAVFPNGQLIEVQEGQFIRSLSATTHTGAHYLVIGYRDKLRLYRDGELLFESDYDEINYISEHAFSVKKGRKYGAVDQNGRLIMKVRYDAINEAINGVSDVLYNGKFGAFNFDDKILIDLSGEQLLETYNRSIFIQKKGGKYGLISKKNELLVEPVFDQVVYWTDSSYMAQLDQKWSIYKLNDQSVIFGDINSYSYISNSENSKVIEFQRENQYGVYDASKGVLLPAVYNDIYNLGNESKPIFLAEKRFAEADYYVVAYYDMEGIMIYSMAYRGDEYELIVCDD